MGAVTCARTRPELCEKEPEGEFLLPVWVLHSGPLWQEALGHTEKCWQRTLGLESLGHTSDCILYCDGRRIKMCSIQRDSILLSVKT